MPATEPELDLALALGATESPSVQKFTIYLPDKDRRGHRVENIEAWIEAGMHLLAEINLGVTRLPWAQGIWKPSDDANEVSEGTTLVYSYLRRPNVFRERIDDIKSFLDDFAEQTGQGEVMVEFFGEQVSGAEAGSGRMYFRTYTIAYAEA